MSTLSMKDYIIKNHELDKFKLLYLENAPRLIFYASKYVDSDTAEDLVHDIFIKIWQKKEIYSVEEGLKTYLFRSVQNACLDYLKHKSIEMTYADEVARRLKIEEIDYYNQSDAAELEKERLDSVYREIAKLPDRCREVFTLAYVDGKKYEQRRSQYAEFRAASDKLCREYGLSVVEQPKTKEPARYARMREAIDQACEDASTPEDFHRALYRQGYIFGADPNRKYAMIRARDGGRAVRLYRLGEEYDLPAIDDRLRGNYLLYGPRLYELKHPPRQYTPKRYRPTENRSILQIFFEVFFGESQMHRLYLYYCYQLGILPKKPQPRINRPELERIWKDTEKILAEHAFVHDHKFPSLQAIVDYRKGLSQQMETLAAQRAEIVKQMRRKDAPPELADQRMALTCKIAELRKEEKIAEGAIKRIQRTRESNRIDRENRMPLHPRPRRRRREQERE